jgi:hypothetical protein
MGELEIAIKPDWGDFKAFTTLPRREAVFVGADVTSMRLVLEIGGDEFALEIGGPAERFTKELGTRIAGPIPLIRWNGITVVGIPVPNGHALFRARTTNEDIEARPR